MPLKSTSNPITASLVVSLSLVLVPLFLTGSLLVEVANASASHSGGSGGGSGSSSSYFIAVPGGNNTGNIIDTYDEVDITMLAFSQAKLGTYLSLIAAAAEVPLSRVVMTQVDNAFALEFGWQYIFPIRIAPPTFENGDTEASTIAAARLEIVLSSPTLKDSHPEMFKQTMIGGRRVKEEFRERVQSQVGVNYVWVAFLIMGLIMLIFAVAVVLRPRGPDSDDQINLDSDEEEEERPVPEGDEFAVLEEKADHAILAGHEREIEKHRQLLLDRRQETKKTLKTLDATLEYDRMWSLPPTYEERQRMKKKKQGGGKGTDFDDDDPFADIPMVGIGSGSGGGGTTKKDAAPSPDAKNPNSRSGSTGGSDDGKDKKSDSSSGDSSNPGGDKKQPAGATKNKEAAPLPAGSPAVDDRSKNLLSQQVASTSAAAASKSQVAPPQRKPSAADASDKLSDDDL